MAAQKILIIDDDPNVQKLVAFYLRRTRHRLFFAGDGISSIAVAQREKPDFIILDVGLPVGDGGTVIDRLTRIPHLAMIPVLVVTGRSQEACERILRCDNVVGYLQKPLDEQSFLGVIDRHIGLAGEPAPIAICCPHCRRDFDAGEIPAETLDAILLDRQS